MTKDLPFAAIIREIKAAKSPPKNSELNFVLFLIAIATILSFFSMLLFSFGAFFLGDYYILILLFFIILSISVISYTLYVVYKIDPKFVLGLIAVIIFIYSILFYISLRDSNILTSGFTLILVIITGWYASIMKMQSEIMQKQMIASINQKRGKYIAEIARSIFSPLNGKLKSFLQILNEGIYIETLSPLKYNFNDVENLNNYISGEIIILPNYRNNITKPAKNLLNIPDDKLQKIYLPKITVSISEINRSLTELKQNLDLIYTNKSLIWSNFKEYCKDIDPNPIFQDDNNCIIFFAAALNQQPSSRFYLKKFSDKPFSDEMIDEFSNRNKEKFLDWLQKSQLSCYVKTYLDNKAELMELISQLSLIIDDLLLEWKIEYFLIESEMKVN